MSGTPIEDIELHRCKYFESWSAERPSTMPQELRRKIRRTRFKHSLTGKRAPHAIDVFDQVREIPEIVDGIRCQCGCADQPGFYSLLSCYESDGMARFCEICQGEGRMVYRLHKSGQSLDEIRAAIDARYG